MRIAIYNIYFSVFGGGERRTAALAAHLARDHDVTLYVREPVDLAKVRSIFGLDLSGIPMVALGDADHFARIRADAPELFINNTHGSTLANPAPLGVYMCMFPEESALNLDSYDVITANSRFTADWIRRRWGYDAAVVYSACQDMGPAAPKQNRIVTVGRFFAPTPTAHHKRQDVLLAAFKQMVDDGLDGWSLAIVGNVGGAEPDRDFEEALRRAAGAYPVTIATAIDLPALRDLYRTSSLYWHATGYGVAANDSPSRLEHFGMSIVEAMSAGAVPLAFNAGGPRETIRPGANGFLWDDTDELQHLTRRLIAGPAEWTRLSTAAATISRTFNVDAYLARMDAIIADLAAGKPLDTAVPI